MRCTPEQPEVFCRRNGDVSQATTAGLRTLRDRAALAHDFNTDRAASATFQALPGASFLVNGASPARNAALMTASAEMMWSNGWAVAATFDGEFSDVTRSYAGRGRFGINGKGDWLASIS